MDSVAEARHVLPLWVAWGPVLVRAAVSFLSCLLGAGIAALVSSVPLLRPGDLHWVERARRSFPPRLALALVVLAFPVSLAVIASLYTGPMAALGGTSILLATWLSGFVGAFAVLVAVSRRLDGRRVGFAAFVRGMASIWLLRYPYLFVAGAAAALMPAVVDGRAVAILAACTLLFGSFLVGLNIPLALAVGLARPAPARLLAVVEKAGARIGLRPAATVVIRWTPANALAFPVARKLAFTEHILEVLDDDELVSVTSHELGHISEPRTVSLARASGVLVLFPLVAARTIVGSFGVWYMGAALLAVIVAVLVLQRLGRRMEERADSVARAHEGDAGTYASALEKIYRANLIPAVLAKGRRVHPDLYDRLLAAGVQPSYPRPRPPSRLPAAAGVLLALGPLLAAAVALHLVPALLRPVTPAGEGAILASMAMTGGSAADLDDLGMDLSRRGESGRAIVMFRAATDLEPAWHGYPAHLAAELSRAGRLAEAAAWLEEARRRCAGACGPSPEIAAAERLVSAVTP